MISYLQAENVSKSYGDKTLFTNISFSINKDEKVALIAKNGAGKTSLLNILCGKDVPDSGNISYRKDINIGYLEQNPKLFEDKTVIEQVFASSDKIVNAVKEYEEALESDDKNRLQKASEQMDLLKAWDFEVKIKQILDILKITDLHKPVRELSGGQKRRLSLANTLINEPTLLILDEPTNHLDFEMIEWLEEFLAKSNTTMLMVTHDRYFLDKVCNEIIEISDNEIFTYRGNYAYYLEKRQERIIQTNTEIEKSRNLLRKEADWMSRMPQARATKAKYRIDNFYKIKEQAEKRIENTEFDIEIQSRRLGNKILEVYNISKSYNNKCLINDFSYKFTKSEKIGIVGKNGVGKSTLLNILTGNITPDSGIIEKGETVVFGYYTQSGIDLEEDKRVIEVIKEIAEIIEIGKGKQISASQFLEYFLFPPALHYTYVSRLSGGERRRLYLMTVLMKNPNFLILDEPTNDLDIMTLNVLEDFLVNFQGCLILVSHDRYFTDKVVDNLFVFEDNAVIKNFPGNYSAYHDELIEERKLEKKSAIQDKDLKQFKPKQVEEKKKLSYKEKSEFESLEKEIHDLNLEKINIENALSDGTCSTNEITEKYQRLTKIIEILDEKEFRWLELSEKL